MAESFTLVSAASTRKKHGRKEMFRKAAIVLALTLVVGSLSAARAEDPDEDFVERYHASVPPLPETHHHAAPVSEPKRPFWPN
jgi:hypothetical protein